MGPLGVGVYRWRARGVTLATGGARVGGWHTGPATTFQTPMPRLRIAALALLSLATGLAAAEPVRRVEIYVQPYYASPARPDGHPEVHVGDAFDTLLASNARADILKVRDLVEAKPDFVSPMTLMVLAIRLYDVGLRDDAVFWFYVAKGRYISLLGVVDEDALGGAPDAIRAFASLAGPVINSYAFCDVDRQLAANDKAWQWVAAHPYMTAFSPQLPAKAGDRAANLKKGVDGLQGMADKARAQLSDPAFRKDFEARREAKGVPADYCWK